MFLPFADASTMEAATVIGGYLTLTGIFAALLKWQEIRHEKALIRQEKLHRQHIEDFFSLKNVLERRTGTGGSA